MRIATVALFTGFVFAVASPATPPETQFKESAPVASASSDIDPIITGKRVSAEHFAKWKAEREKYLKCPECVANQPFPED